jgi:hypothetical protein
VFAVAAGPLLYSYAAPWSASLDTECNASGLFPESLASPSFTCDITLNTTGPLPPLNISNRTSFTFHKRSVPAPKPGAETPFLVPFFLQERQSFAKTGSGQSEETID